MSAGSGWFGDCGSHARRLTVHGKCQACEADRLAAEAGRLREELSSLANGWLADLSQEPLDDHGRVVHTVTKDHAREVLDVLKRSAS